MTLEYRMYLKFLQKPRCLGWFKTSQAPWSAVKKARLNSSKENFKTKSSRLSTKRNLSTLLNFLFPLVSFIGVFSILKCKTSVLKAITRGTPANHFIDRWHLLRCQIRRLLPHPLCGCPFDICGGGGMGGLFWARIFFPKPLELEIFHLTYDGVSFFIRREGKFFQCRILFFPGISLQAFLRRNQ